MKIKDMKVNTFWKGEYGIKSLVEDEGQTYKVQLLIKGSQIMDYSCSCVGSKSSSLAFGIKSGSSHRGMCAHAKAVWEEYQREAKDKQRKPVITSQEARTRRREYPNREVDKISMEGEEEQINLVPLLLVTREGVRLGLRIGKERIYILKDLHAFVQAVERGAYV